MMRRICWMTAGALLVAGVATAQDQEKIALDKAEVALVLAEQKVEQSGAAADKFKAEAARADIEKMLAESKIIGSPGMMLLGGVVTGAPYSAEEVTQFTQTLGDGTRIQRETRVKVYRDGQGRLRRETPNQVNIMDPVAGVAYELDPVNLTARKMTVSVGTGPNGTVVKQIGPGKMAVTVNTQSKIGTEQEVRVNVMAAEAGSAEDVAKLKAKAKLDTAAQAGGSSNTYSFSTAPGGGGPPQMFYFVGKDLAYKTAGTSESLGQQNMEGLMSEGTRRTETLPAGAIGNDRPIQTINERWYSPDLKTTVMTRNSDPRTGEEVFRLTNVRRGEPGADLFQVPGSYQIVGN